MKKKYLRFLTGLMTASLLFGNAMPVFAADVSVSGDNATGSTPTEFSVDADALGGGLVVTIPASLDLTQDASGDYTVNDVVSAYGNMSPSKLLKVSTDDEITYFNSGITSITATGYVFFGTDGVEKYTAEQTKNSITSRDNRVIDVSVDKADIAFIGTYNSTVYFDIEVVDADSEADAGDNASAVSLFSWSASATEATVTGLEEDATETNLVIPSTYNSLPVTSVGASSFASNKMLTSVAIPSSVTLIDQYAFNDCSNLSTVTMAEGVEEIGESSFANCTSLESVAIPDSVTAINQNAFAGCTSLESVTYDGTEYTSEDNLTTALDEAGVSVGTSAFENTGMSASGADNGSNGETGSEESVDYSYLSYSSNSEGITVDGIQKGYSYPSEIVIPSTIDGATVTVIENNSWSPLVSKFTSLDAVTSVKIPNTVTTIKYSVFYGCTNLESVVLSDNIAMLGSDAFGDCTKLSSVTYQGTTYQSQSALLSALSANGVVNEMETDVADCAYNIFAGTGLTD